MYETWLIPYLEGTLDAERRAQLEARLTDDPRLASELSALRRADPRLRAVTAGLRRSEATAPAPASLWPGLRERLDVRPARPRIGPAFWWTGGGLCAAGLLVLAVLFGPVLHPEATDRKTAQGSKNVPLIVSHPDNAVGTRVAERLRARDQRVAAEKKAADIQTRTLVAARPTPAQTLPLAPTAQVPKGAASAVAPPTHSPPPAAVRVPSAPPLPTLPPLRLAQREPETATLRPYPVGLPPAPTHSPPPAPTHSPLPAAPSQQMASAGTASAADGRVENDARTPGAPAMAPAAAPSPRPLQRQASAAKQRPGATLRQQLEQTLTPPAYGTDAGEAQEQQLLRMAHQSAAGRALRNAQAADSLEAQDIAPARLQAALDEGDGDWEGAAVRWRLIVRRPDAVDEDWFRLAQAETHLGRTDAARQAYGQALRPSSVALSSAHRDTALQYAPPVRLGSP